MVQNWQDERRLHLLEAAGSTRQGRATPGSSRERQQSRVGRYIHQGKGAGPWAAQHRVPRRCAAPSGYELRRRSRRLLAASWVMPWVQQPAVLALLLRHSRPREAAHLAVFTAQQRRRGGRSQRRHPASGQQAVQRDGDGGQAVDPGGGGLPRQACTQVRGEVVAVHLQQMVPAEGAREWGWCVCVCEWVGWVGWGGVG